MTADWASSSCEGLKWWIKAFIYFYLYLVKVVKRLIDDVNPLRSLMQSKNDSSRGASKRRSQSSKWNVSGDHDVNARSVRLLTMNNAQYSRESEKFGIVNCITMIMDYIW